MKKKSLLLTAVATLGLTTATIAQNVPNYVPTNGLIGWWAFNGNANDESGNGNNGIVNGATLDQDRFGNANMAYNFDGLNDFIEVVDNNTVDLGTAYTISIWALVDSVASIDHARYLINKGCSPTPSYRIYYQDYESIKNYTIDCFNPDRSYAFGPSSNYLWTNLCAVFDGLSLKFYVNGKFFSSVNQTGTVVNSDLNLLIGCSNVSGNCPVLDGWFAGKLDDIGIWNRALTQQEISDLYNVNICYQYITVTDTLVINTNLSSFNPVTYQNSIKIFPNPTHDHITIDYGNFAILSGYHLKIENSLGQQVFQTNISQQTDYLSLNNWGGNGLYFVKIIDPQGNTIDIRKIVLQ